MGGGLGDPAPIMRFVGLAILLTALAAVTFGAAVLVLVMVLT